MAAGDPAQTGANDMVTGAALEPESAEAFYDNEYATGEDDPRRNKDIRWYDTEVFHFAEAYATKLRATVEELRRENQKLILLIKS